MKAITFTDQLKAALNTVAPAVPSKATLPVLQNVHLRAAAGALHLQTTNLEIAIATQIEADVTGEWATTLPHKLLSALVGTLAAEHTTLTYDSTRENVHIESNGSEANIKGIEADEFPSVPQVDTDAITLDGPTFRNAVAAVTFAAATDDTRPVLACVSLHGSTLAATDGYRLSVYTIDADLPSCRVPAKALDTAARFTGETVEIALSASGGQVMFRSGKTTLVSRLVDGKFPDYQRIIPKQYSTRAILSKHAALRGAKQAAVFAASSANICKLSTTADTLTLAANASEIGDNKTEMDVQATGDPVLVALNVKFLADALQAIQTPDVAIELQNASKPAVFKPVGADNHLIVVMPMSIH